MDEISGLIIKMTEFFSGDPKRIQHFIKVHTFARVIGRAEGLDIRTMHCLDVASVVHDIGIKPAEERYGKESVFARKRRCSKVGQRRLRCFSVRLRSQQFLWLKQ